MIAKTAVLLAAFAAAFCAVPAARRGTGRQRAGARRRGVRRPRTLRRAPAHLLAAGRGRPAGRASTRWPRRREPAARARVASALCARRRVVGQPARGGVRGAGWCWRAPPWARGWIRNGAARAARAGGAGRGGRRLRHADRLRPPPLPAPAPDAARAAPGGRVPRAELAVRSGAVRLRRRGWSLSAGRSRCAGAVSAWTAGCFPCWSFAVLAVRSVRFAADVALVAAPLLAVGLDAWSAIGCARAGRGCSPTRSRRWAPPRCSRGSPPARALAGRAAAGHRSRHARAAAGRDRVRRRATACAIACTTTSRPGRTCCSIPAAGYPRHRVFVDPRLPAYPPEFHRLLGPRRPDPRRMERGDGRLRRRDRACSSYAGVNRRVAWWDPERWALVFREADARVFVRRLPRFAPLIASREIPATFAFSPQEGNATLPLAARPAASPVPDCEWQRRLGDLMFELDGAPSRAHARRVRPRAGGARRLPARRGRGAAGGLAGRGRARRRARRGRAGAVRSRARARRRRARDADQPRRRARGARPHRRRGGGVGRGDRPRRRRRRWRRAARARRARLLGRRERRRPTSRARQAPRLLLHAHELRHQPRAARGGAQIDRPGRDVDRGRIVRVRAELDAAAC